jgi:hypothetical protein
MAVDNRLLDPNIWNDKWDNLFLKYQEDLRHAYYLNALLDTDYSILEIAAGSFRDMAFLNKLGFDCYGCDFSEHSVQMAKNFFPDFSQKIFYADAKNLNKFNKSYDVTYHNGFWVLFDNNDYILQLYKVQKEITKKLLIFTVHNGHNKVFKNYFNDKMKIDNLYAIRFFEIDEIFKILNLNISEVSIYPVGKAKKSNEDLLVNSKNTDKNSMLLHLRANNFEYLESSERLLFVIYI